MFGALGGTFTLLDIVPSAGLGPATFWFEAKRSIQLSYEGDISNGASLSYGDML